MDDSIYTSKCENSAKFSKASTSITSGFKRNPLEGVIQHTPLLNTDSHVEINISKKPHRRKCTWSKYSGVSSKATMFDKNGYKSKKTITPSWRRNTWPKLPTIPREETFHDGKKHKHSGRIKKYFIKKKKKIDSKKNKVKHQVSPFLRILPFILAVTGLVLPVADLATDMASSYRICTAECKCEYTDDITFCHSSQDMCGDAMINGTCHASRDSCGDAMINGTKVGDYCATNNRTICMSKEAWPVNKKTLGFQLRHPLWCRLSIEFITIPSILNNVLTLISLLNKFKYKRYLITAGLPSLANIHRSVAYLALTLMAMLQILPYMCICLRIITAWRVFRKHISEDEDSELCTVNRIIGIIFSLTEDLPQLTLQTMFFVRAIVHDTEDGILDDLSWVAVAGLVTSCLSLSKNYTMYVMNLGSSATSPVYIFSTALITVGGHVLVCCLMAVGHLHSGYTKRILLPVSTAIAIQISLHIFKLRFSYSGKSSINEMKNRFSHGQTNCKKFLTGVLILGSGIRSILFSAIMDGYSPLGLWSCACFASWALRLKVKFFTDSDPETTSLSSTALRWSMISYAINSILVFKNYPDRKNSILVSFLFLIYPIYLCAISKNQYKYMRYGLIIGDDLIFDKIIITLIPSLVMLINVLSLILNKVKFQKAASEDQVHSRLIRKWASMEI